MSLQTANEGIKSKIGHESQLRYLRRFIEDDRLGNSACQNRQTLSRSISVWDRNGAGWVERPASSNVSAWSALPNSSGQAIILEYLDSEAIKGLMLEFPLAPEFFQTHLAGCEGHRTGRWTTSDLTTAPCLRSSRQHGNFLNIDYRRPYEVPEKSNIELFDYARKQRCSLLRSFHLTEGATVLFQHERFTVAWFKGDTRRPGAVICICDPTVDEKAGYSLFHQSIAAIQALPARQPFDKSIINCFHSPLLTIVSLWNTVVFHIDLQVSALEDQVEHDFWDKPQNPVSILHKTQRLSRRVTAYLGQLISMESDIAWTTSNDALEAIKRDTEDIKTRLNVLLQRTDKASSALLGSIAISEGAKASSLTAIVLWFTPLSLAISIVSIDGHAPLGGRKLWIMACIAIPLLLLVLAVANMSDSFIALLGKRRRGRALLSLFKPETRV